MLFPIRTGSTGREMNLGHRIAIRDVSICNASRYILLLGKNGKTVSKSKFVEATGEEISTASNDERSNHWPTTLCLSLLGTFQKIKSISILGGGFKYFFPLRKLGKMNPVWLSHIFQMGWFNPPTTIPSKIHMGVSKNRDTPKWMVYKEHPIKMDDLGVPSFSETPTCANTSGEHHQCLMKNRPHAASQLQKPILMAWRRRSLEIGWYCWWKKILHQLIW